MGAESRFAELKLAPSGIMLLGRVVKMSRREAILCLETVPTDKGTLSEGTSTELVIMARGSFYVASGNIVAQQNNIVTMAFDAPVTTIQRRNRPRRHVQLAVAFRSIHSNNCAGAWHHAETIDVSAGGMRLCVPPNITIAAAIEIHFMVGEVTHSVRGLMDIGLDIAPPLAAPMIRASARVIHNRVQRRGDSIVGIAFTRIIPSDAMRLARFCSEGMAASEDTHCPAA